MNADPTDLIDCSCRILRGRIRKTEIVVMVGTFCALSMMLFLPAAVAYAGEPTQISADPLTIKRIFMNGSAESRTKLALGLQIIDHSAGNTSENITVPCTTFQSVRIENPDLERGKRYAVLIFRSGDAPGSCWFDFVTVLRRIASSQWKLVATWPLFSRDTHPSITFPSLLREGEQEIMIDKDCIRSGTGDWQYDTIVIRVRDDRLLLIMDATEELNFAIPAEGGNTDEEEHGTFFLVPAKPPEINTFDILEKQQIRKQTHALTRWRLFTWSKEAQQFRPEAVDASSAAKMQRKSTQAPGFF